MSLAPELLEIIVCPKCKGDLVYKEDESVLDCEACSLRYEVDDDIPVLIIDKATSTKGPE